MTNDNQMGDNSTGDIQTGDNQTARNQTLVTLATYNEIENLPKLVEAIFQHAPKVDVLVVDDNSPDGTGQWCDEQAKVDSRIHCLHREGKLGLGTATVAAMKYAIEKEYRFMLNLDADFSHPPQAIPTMIDAMDKDEQPVLDVMIGSRYVPGGKIEGWPLKRHMMSRCVNFYARWMLGLSAKDCSGSFRCYRTELLAKLKFDTIKSQGYSFQEEILWHLKRLGARFAETPITFVDRVHGQSKIDSKEAFAALRIILNLGVKNIFSRRSYSAI